jgi:hypothetical protein
VGVAERVSQISEARIVTTEHQVPGKRLQ